MQQFLDFLNSIDLENIKAYDNDLKKQGIFFPDVEDPILLEYELGSIEDIYKNTLLLLLNKILQIK